MDCRKAAEDVALGMEGRSEVAAAALFLRNGLVEMSAIACMRLSRLSLSLWRCELERLGF